eukprot:jgi/Chlat1/4558/Chrsp29S04463
MAASAMSGGEGREVRLWNDKKEREMYESFADLYAIIKTTEKLEKAYVRDAVTPAEYEPACLKLIAQFKTLKSSLKDTVPDVERFAATYKLDCPAALTRLLHSGMTSNIDLARIPATVEFGKPKRDDSGSSRVVAETVQHFITAMDSVKLGQVAVDQLYPYVSDILQSMHKLPQLPPDFEGKEKCKAWLVQMNKMQASDELTDAQARQLMFDLESSYNSFMANLHQPS